MIVLTLTDCPNALRGDLTRWLFEIDTNIYVGKQSARVRENIWARVTENAKSGRAVMVYPAKNEQGFDFRVHGAAWEPIDFDGLKLMMRPHLGGAHANTGRLKPGFSKAAKYRAAKRFASAKKPPALPDTYVVVDVETTGFSHETDEIIEIGAIKVIEGDNDNADVFQALVRAKAAIPPHIEKLTGITNETLKKDGRELKEVISGFLAFTGELPVMSHNAKFDMGFLRAACERCGIAMPSNSWIDTLQLARKLLDDPPDYKLGTLMRYLGIEQVEAHRGVGDCSATVMLYERLREMLRGGDDSK
jgi:CRISPR-associated protein Cas2